jgi:hypothetical protein
MFDSPCKLFFNEIMCKTPLRPGRHMKEKRKGKRSPDSCYKDLLRLLANKEDFGGMGVDRHVCDAIDRLLRGYSLKVEVRSR